MQGLEDEVVINHSGRLPPSLWLHVDPPARHPLDKAGEQDGGGAPLGGGHGPSGAVRHAGRLLVL
eukprot:CAMPEP_0169429642 /NCGR_PEP_ID=MMETSP1042-20121227/1974_1 /TAXON_ID=464988 /ORGANISM="Hemiselmis andersenii, Strain CCMP1180" /LENGTH=64 /DNA_ID=CAMNT_0009539903 /DNA_START=582 /DNA_END=773 /DNA_ORIENTATION=-